MERVDCSRFALGGSYLSFEGLGALLSKDPRAASAEALVLSGGIGGGTGLGPMGGFCWGGVGWLSLPTGSVLVVSEDDLLIRP